MKGYQVKRLKFRNGERTSIILRRGSRLPVHEAVLFIDSCRVQGLAANTIHEVARYVALLIWQMDVHGIDLYQRFQSGRFLSIPEIARFAASTQFHIKDLDKDVKEVATSVGKRIVRLEQVRMRHKASTERQPVDVHTQATRLRVAGEYLDFLSTYVAATLSVEKSLQLEAETKRGLKAIKGHLPRESNQAKLGARQGLSDEEMQLVMRTIHPDSASNPWKNRFVRRRNWVMVRTQFAAGIRRGENLNIQIRDINPTSPKFTVVRRPDSLTDERMRQPTPKTRDRELELHPSILRDLMNFINNDRYAIKAARKVPQVFVSSKGKALSDSLVDKIFAQIRKACPGLPVHLVSHVPRHTWNDQFSEVADEMGLSGAVEEKARNNQQGWSENSKMAAIYTRRHATRKGNQVVLKMQEKLERSVYENE